MAHVNKEGCFQKTIPSGKLERCGVYIKTPAFWKDHNTHDL